MLSSVTRGFNCSATERKRGAPPPSETVIVTCHLCSEKRRYLPAEIYAGIPSANINGNWYAPGLPHSASTFLDLNVANSPDSSEAP
jgi:hypothetical protein